MASRTRDRTAAANASGASGSSSPEAYLLLLAWGAALWIATVARGTCVGRKRGRGGGSRSVDGGKRDGRWG